MPVSENAQRKANVAVLRPSGMCDQSCFVLEISCNMDNRTALVTATTVYHPQAVNLLQNFRGTTHF